MITTNYSCRNSAEHETGPRNTHPVAELPVGAPPHGAPRSSAGVARGQTRRAKDLRCPLRAPVVHPVAFAVCNGARSRVRFWEQDGSGGTLSAAARRGHRARPDVSDVQEFRMTAASLGCALSSHRGDQPELDAERRPGHHHRTDASSVRLTVGQRSGARQAGLTLKRQAERWQGTSRAHQHEICPVSQQGGPEHLPAPVPVLLRQDFHDRPARTAPSRRPE